MRRLATIGLCICGAIGLGATVLLDGPTGQFNTAATTVAVSGYTTIGDPIRIRPEAGFGNDGLVVVEVSNAAGSGTLDGFKIQMKDHDDGEWYDYLSGTDFDTATSAMLFASTTGPHEIAAEGVAHVHFKARGVEIRFQASSASTTASVTIRGSVGKS